MDSLKSYIRDSVEEDIKWVAKDMRDIDKYECWVVSHCTGDQALENGFKNSLVCKTGVINNEPVAMFGITDMLQKDVGLVWLLGTNRVPQAKELFITTAKDTVNGLLEYRPVLFNYVYARNWVAIKWLKFLGFTMKSPSPYGLDKKPFRMFHKVKENNHV